jgi:hypothetical protein
MRSMRIIAHASTPIAVPGSRDIHIDGVLAWAWVTKNCPGEYGSISRQSSASEMPFAMEDLGLSVVRIGGHCFTVSTSWNFPESASLGSTYIARRKTGQDMAARSLRVDPSSPDRPCLTRSDCVKTPYCEWYAHGDMLAVEELLGSVRSVGSFRGAGYGAVSRWSVEPSDIAIDEMLVMDGVAQRNLPEAFVSVASVRSVAVRPPYWLPDLTTLGVDPGTQTGISDSGRSQIRGLM